MEQNEVARAYKEILEARRLQSDFPELGDMRLNNATYRGMAHYLEEQGVQAKNLERIAGHMIRGHNGGLNIPAFEGLVPDVETRNIISKQLMSNLGASRRGVRAQGYTPWQDSFSEELEMFEEQYVRVLMGAPEFQYSSGGNRGKPNWEKIGNELSNYFPKREPSGIRSRIKREDIKAAKKRDCECE